ncbi:MAG: thioredoxin family protein [Sulfurimonas sp.]|jgi:uncharacterized protein YyaL (SSP411 family)|nr:thioredoxin family protein [Sulfurimonas sp.]
MKYIIMSIVFLSSLFASELNWHSDYKKAVEIAKKERKDVYVLITSDSCRWCRKFEDTTLEDKRVLELLRQKYILVHADRDMDALPKEFNIKSVPRHYFVTPDEKIIFTFVGYWDELDFRSYLRDVDKERAIKVKKGEIK